MSYFLMLPCRKLNHSQSIRYNKKCYQNNLDKYEKKPNFESVLILKLI